MKNVRLITSLVAIAALGLTARAQTMVPTSSFDSRSAGLVGQTWGGASYSWIDLDRSGIDASAITLNLNQNSGENLDTLFEYEYIRSDRFAGTRLTQHSLLLGARAFVPNTTFKPFAEGGVGWMWQRVRGGRDDSWAWMAGAGVELEFSPAFAAAPYVRYEDAPDLPGSGTWNYGVRGNFWVSERYAVTGAVERDDDRNMGYTVGFAFRY
jgi:hypothetical protein